MSRRSRPSRSGSRRTLRSQSFTGCTPVLFEKGEGEAAIDPLIDALRWDPENADRLENLQTLHVSVHQEKTQLERQRENCVL